MRKECVIAVEKAALLIGKKITAAELNGIEGKVVEQMKELAKKDRVHYASLSKAEILKEAGEMAVNQFVHDAIKKRQRAELTITKSAERQAAYGVMVANGMSHLEALTRFVAFKGDDKGQIVSLESEIAGTSAYYKRNLSDLWKLDNENSLLGLITNKEGMTSFVKEAFGIDSGNPLAKKAWAGLDKVRSNMIAEFNSLGGDISKLVDYRNPQTQDPYRVLKEGQDSFVNDHLAWVDREKYVNLNGSLMDDAQLKQFLSEAYLTLATDGKSKPPNEGGGASTVANRMKAHRQLHFKSPEAYIAAMEKYGAGSPIDQVFGGIDTLSRDIALTKKFGPNAIHEFDKDLAAASRADGVSSTVSFLPSAHDRAKSAFENLSGQTEVTSVKTARFFQSVRSMNVANKLGSMVFAQIADLATAQATARAMNIPLSELMTWIGRMSGQEARDAARMMGFGLESATNAIARFGDGASTTGFFGKAAAVVTTVQGAHAWTRALRQAFGSAMAAKFGDLATKYSDIASMHERDQAVLKSKGVTDSDFAIWKLAKLDDLKMLSANEIDAISSGEIRKLLGLRSNAEAEAARRDAAIKLTSMFIEETHMAVLQPSVLQSFNYQKGNLIGELGSLLLQFKSFPWAYLRQHFLERANFAGSGVSPLMYRTKLLASTTVMGGIALILGDLAQGKDPRQMYGDNDKMIKFGFSALLKGGGLPVVSELLELAVGQVESPFNSGAKLVGPTGPVVLGAGKALGYGGAYALSGFEDEKYKTQLTKSLYSLGKDTMPGQNLWFARGVLHNVLLNDLQESANPGYTRRANKRAEDTLGTSYWLGMDQETRMPNFGNISGN